MKPSFAATLGQAAELMAKTKVPSRLASSARSSDDPLLGSVAGGSMPGSRADSNKKSGGMPWWESEPRTAIELGRRARAAPAAAPPRPRVRC